MSIIVPNDIHLWGPNRWDGDCGKNGDTAPNTLCSQKYGDMTWTGYMHDDGGSTSGNTRDRGGLGMCNAEGNKTLPCKVMCGNRFNGCPPKSTFESLGGNCNEAKCSAPVIENNNDAVQVVNFLNTHASSKYLSANAYDTLYEYCTNQSPSNLNCGADLPCPLFMSSSEKGCQTLWNTQDKQKMWNMFCKNNPDSKICNEAYMESLCCVNKDNVPTLMRNDDFFHNCYNLNQSSNSACDKAVGDFCNKANLDDEICACYKDPTEAEQQLAKYATDSLGNAYPKQCYMPTCAKSIAYKNSDLSVSTGCPDICAAVFKISGGSYSDVTVEGNTMTVNCGNGKTKIINTDDNGHNGNNGNNDNGHNDDPTKPIKPKKPDNNNNKPTSGTFFNEHKGLVIAGSVILTIILAFLIFMVLIKISKNNKK